MWKRIKKIRNIGLIVIAPLITDYPLAFYPKLKNGETVMLTPDIALDTEYLNEYYRNIYWKVWRRKRISLDIYRFVLRKIFETVINSQ